VEALLDIRVVSNEFYQNANENAIEKARSQPVGFGLLSITPSGLRLYGLSPGSSSRESNNLRNLIHSRVALPAQSKLI